MIYPVYAHKDPDSAYSVTIPDFPDYEGGFWLFVDVDLSKVSTKSVRVNISLPACVLSRIDRFAAQHHETRSGLLAKAALAEMQRQEMAGPRGEQP